MNIMLIYLVYAVTLDILILQMQEFREAMNIREVNGLRPIVSPMNASTKTLHTPWVLTTQIIHDYALDYSNIFKSLSSCDKNFSWSAHIVHCDGSISKVQYQSKQYQVITNVPHNFCYSLTFKFSYG